MIDRDNPFDVYAGEWASERAIRFLADEKDFGGRRCGPFFVLSVPLLFTRWAGLAQSAIDRLRAISFSVGMIAPQSR